MLTVRPTTAEDWQILRTLRLRALHDHPTAYGAEADVEGGQNEAFWHERATGIPEQRTTLLAEHVNTPAGILTVVRSQPPKFRHSADIYAVYVTPEARGAGVGDALLQEAVNWASALGLRHLRLEVNAINTSAIRLYARHGFTVYGVNPEMLQYNNHYYDELLMVKRL